MAKRLLLRIVTPQALVLETEADEITAPGSVGEFGVLPEHVTFLTSLEAGVLRFRSSDGVRAFAVRGGFAEVRNDTVTILAEAALAAEEVDTDEVQGELSALQAQLRSLSPGDPSYAALNREQRWGEARLAAARFAHRAQYH